LKKLIIFILITALFNLAFVFKNAEGGVDSVGEPDSYFSKKATETKSQAIYHFLLSEINRFKGNLVEAVNEATKASEADPSSSYLHANLAALYYNTGNINEAEKHANEAMKLNPQFSQIYYICGGIFEKSGNLVSNSVISFCFFSCIVSIILFY